VSRDCQLLGRIVVADTVRPEASAAISLLREMLIRPVLLTGDTSPVAATVARELGIAELRRSYFRRTNAHASKISSAMAPSSRWSVMGSMMRPLSPKPLSALRWVRY